MSKEQDPTSSLDYLGHVAFPTSLCELGHRGGQYTMKLFNSVVERHSSRIVGSFAVPAKRWCKSQLPTETS
eukprot:2910966-Amphidinium_carterae.1